MQPEVTDWRGYEVVGSDGSKIGTVKDFFVDRVTNEPEWALVNMGLFGTRQTLVPFDGSTVEDGRLRVPYDKAVVKDAPGLEPGNAISERELTDLYAYYGLTSPTGAGDVGAQEPADSAVEGRGQERELIEREHELREAQDELRERQADLEARQGELEQREAALEARVDELGERETAVDERESQERESPTGATAPGRAGEPDYAGTSGGDDGGAFSTQSGAKDDDAGAATDAGVARGDRPAGTGDLGGRLRRFGGPS